jgi:hypothetical protein
MQPFTNIADISDDLRERAIKHTAETLRKFNDVRRALELPVDHLPIVIDTYSKVVAALIAETEREELAKRTQRLPMTLRSHNRDYQPMKIAPGEAARVVGRAQAVQFRPEDIAIHGDRSRWMVHDIMVGNRSQFVDRRGPAAGSEFGPGGILEHLRLDVAQTAMDITIIVEYVGPEPEGEVFEATMVGTAIS